MSGFIAGLGHLDFFWLGMAPNVESEKTLVRVAIAASMSTGCLEGAYQFSRLGGCYID